MNLFSLIAVSTALALAPFSSVLSAKTVQPTTDLMQKIKPATIKVLLSESQDRPIVEVRGAYKVFCPLTDSLISSFSSARKGRVQVQENGLFWGETFPGSFAMRIVPANAQTSVLVNGIQYKGCVELYEVNGKLRVINEVDIENYLRSCLATQFSHISESEVLNALVIVARTNTYYKASKYPEAPWHVKAEDDGYQGYANTFQYFPIEQAIGATRHAILTYQDHLFPASWSENSGGKTASPTAIFKENASSPEGVAIDGMESERLKSSWSFQVSKQELANVAKLAKLSNVALYSEKNSGKVYAVKLGDEASSKTLDFFTLQKAIGSGKLKSNDFTIEVLDQSVKFKGFGVGHGVGLCLHTAKLMAKQGHDAKKILSQFFKGTEINKSRNLPSSKEI